MRRRPTAIWSLVGIATALAACAAMWRSSDLGLSSADLERQQAAARREGVPIDWSDLRRLAPPVPEADNAAPYYVRGFAEFHAANGAKGLSDRALEAILDGKAKPEDLAEAKETLAADSRALVFVVEGSEHKFCRFDRPWEEGSRLLLPEFSDERAATRALVLRAALATEPAAAGRDLRAAARIATHAGSEPIMISPLVGAAVEAVVERGIRAVARKGGAWAEAARPALGALGPLPDAHRFLAAESAMGRRFATDLATMNLREVSMISTTGEGERPLPFALRFIKLKFVRDAFEARTIEYWRKVYAALPADPLDWRGLQAAANVPLPPGPSGALVALSAPPLTGVADLAARMEAQRRLTRAALDLESGRKAPLPSDPFGDGPIKVRRDIKGWTLWSVGPAGNNEGGKAKTKSGNSVYDLVVTVP